MVLSGAALLAALVLPAAADEVKVSYLYKLSNFNGAIPYASPRIIADRARKEVYVLTASGVSIFNSSGMEIYRADYDPEVGALYDAAVDGDGNIIAIVSTGKGPVITVCNYRLEPQRTIELRNLPPEFAGFSPNQLRYRDGRLYLASYGEMKIVVTDLKGGFIKGYDIFAILTAEFLDDKIEEKGPGVMRAISRADYGIDGFNVDARGNMIFVIPVTGRGCRLSPEGTATQFGKRGSAPGKFGIPSGIVADDAGNYLVSDKLRGVVLIFNNDLKFVSEFSSFGGRDDYLVGPSTMDMDGDGKLYVGQTAGRGVHVYRLGGND